MDNLAASFVYQSMRKCQNASNLAETAQSRFATFVEEHPGQWWKDYSIDVMDEGLDILGNCDRTSANLKEASATFEDDIAQQEKTNAAATSVAPEVIAFLAGFSIVIAAVEMLADHFLEK